MKKSKFAIIAVSLLFSIISFAGLKVDIPVFLDIDNGSYWYAEGSVTDAAESKNSVEAIGCGVKMWKDEAFGPGLPTPDWGFCQATDASGQSVACATTDVSMIEAIYAMDTNSYIQFQWVPEDDVIARLGIFRIETGPIDGECIRIGVSTQSQYHPGKEDKK